MINDSLDSFTKNHDKKYENEVDCQAYFNDGELFFSASDGDLAELSNELDKLFEESMFIIEEGVLKDYIGLKSDIVIPEGVTAIGDYAFKNKALVSIKMPDSVTSIGRAAFFGCSNLLYVRFSKNLKVIGDGAFENCKRFIYLEIPQGVTTIGSNVFNGCIHLRDIRLPYSVNYIGHNAFRSCADLNNIIIENGEITIHNNAFDSNAKSKIVCVDKFLPFFI